MTGNRLAGSTPQAFRYEDILKAHRVAEQGWEEVADILLIEKVFPSRSLKGEATSKLQHPMIWKLCAFG
jgi:2-C-methyl-D-erythritol 4-phosphate cytidylyltransferase